MCESVFFFYIIFANPMFLKKLYTFLVFSSPSDCCILDGFPRIRLVLLNLGYFSVMC